MPRKTITMDSEIVNAIDAWAKAKGVTKDEAYDRFGKMAVVRHNALANYAKKGGAPKAKKAGVKKAGAAKAGKGKGKKAKGQ